ncbi:DUF779 domain-containing protein [Cellulosimicrobium protaetiae]|uniref:DUF779 domain-containing protein n=1 Tax=Cellulosimicrobium protaetiae TaxID=2587808 RepID=A0A6M5UKV5_9MICO|nr:DUF779 domain-containing protein [Cellulosimicrobium protaetiae]QJW37389.1 DUF779 domain-containing protein [Cellulosimicrobium protaetiae]
MPDDVPSPAPVGAPPARVDLTDDAAALLARLRTVHGELMFHQSGGCCDGSSPMCYPQGDFLLGDADVHLGDLVVVADAGDGSGEPGPGGFRVPVWMSRAQFEYWKHTHLTIDVVPGRGAGFSVEAPEGVRFIIRSRLLTDDEWAVLAVGA